MSTPNPQAVTNPGRSALICVVLAAAAALTVAFVPWSALMSSLAGVLGPILGAVVYALGWVFFVPANLLSLNPVATVAVMVFVVAALACMHRKKVYSSTPTPGAAPWQKFLAAIEVPTVLALFVASFFLFISVVVQMPRIHKDTIATYQRLMQATPEGMTAALSGDRLMERWPDAMARNGEVSRLNFRRVCLTYVQAMPADSPYTMTINGAPAQVSGCSFGPNYMVWRPRT